MPIYEAVCMDCGKYHEYVRKADHCHETPFCCGVQTRKVILSAPMGIVDIPAYESPATGKMITSRAERREDLKRSGCREWEGIESERRESERQKKYQEEKQEAALDRTVRQAWADLPPSKKAAALAATV